MSPSRHLKLTVFPPDGSRCVWGVWAMDNYHIGEYPDVILAVDLSSHIAADIKERLD